MQENTNRRFFVSGPAWTVNLQAGSGKKQKPISKIINSERVGSMVQVVKYLFSKCKALS
jgi:hypothetical protein